MSNPIDRRSLLGFLAAAGIAPAFSQGRSRGESLEFGPESTFSFEELQARARALAGQPFQASLPPSPDILQHVDYDAHGKIRFKIETALWGAPPDLRRHPVSFFHLGRYFENPVRIFAVEGGKAREIVYRQDYFDIPTDSAARKLPKSAGFAGFRFHEASDGAVDWKKNDWVAFLGASYFRALGELNQYGLSARGIAIDVANPGVPEEFPAFTHIWLEQAKDADGVTVYALLDGPSLSGAYRIAMKRAKGVVMEVDCRLHLRKDVSRFGIAPLTSMYWFSENAKPQAIDWRPEVHDSDGLALWTGAGERIWRPLNNPPQTITSAFADNNPRGFGLMQRDRAFDHYLDGVHYERRPSLWVEPLGDWGRGAVQLVEIPTDDEIHDNIVAQWSPEKPARAGDAAAFRYRLHWLADEPFPSSFARCVATRFGNGGQPGKLRPKGVHKFVLEFLGETLKQMPAGVKPEIVLWASRGSFSNILTEPVPNDAPGYWRAQFDLAVDGKAPVEMRAFLKQGDKVLSETWLYQYHPA